MKYKIAIMSKPIIEATMPTILANALPALFAFNLSNCLDAHCIKCALVLSSAIIINGDMRKRMMYNTIFIAVILC